MCAEYRTQKPAAGGSKQICLPIVPGGWFTTWFLHCRVFSPGRFVELEALSCSEITGDSSEDGTQLQPLWRCRISSHLRFWNGNPWKPPKDITGWPLVGNEKMNPHSGLKNHHWSRNTLWFPSEKAGAEISYKFGEEVKKRNQAGFHTENALEVIGSDMDIDMKYRIYGLFLLHVL